ncbi:hypothetical protein QFC22_006717 [Naganishia vaughanmartiniae]|uniref:Uncharacterized protein n=1 Tax=Naganishia vaughanmartiniae TaxID=1424756 RepID=A0ACC2WGQ3_9TREE|nr:hypothetical protein QFC22_006717 [Naganishia vaughanmartiniae]
MHLLLENVGKGLLDLWSGTYKAQTIRGNAKSKSAELYVLSKSAWDRMDAAVVASGKLIPTAISGTLPSVDRFVSSLPDPTRILAFMGSDMTQPLKTDDTGYSCQLSSKIKSEDIPWRRYNAILANYLSATYYTDAAYRDGTQRILRTQEIEALDIRGWNNLKYHPDYSGHKYGCGFGGRAERLHDKSWVKFNQSIDKEAEDTEAEENAKFDPETRFGQLQAILEFEWEGESTIVTIIQPWNSEPWFAVPHPPERLLSAQSLQAVDVRNVLAPAGRVIMEVMMENGSTGT